jgi:twitching motility protein PilT
MRIDRDSIIRLLREAQDAGATDIHMKVPGRPCLRVDGSLVCTSHGKLLPDDTHRAAGVLMGLAGVEIPLARSREAEFAFGIGGVGRFRVHLFKQRGSIGILIHRMAVEVPSLEGLQVPSEWGRMVGVPGLVLCAGAGRRELLAAMVDSYNQRSRGHVILLEEKMEYLHSDHAASISQREIGIDTDDWGSGLQSALRQDPDLVVLGDIANVTVAELALRAAESGIAMMVGIPSSDPARAVPWLSTLFGRRRESEIAKRVADVLVAAFALNHQGATELALDADCREAIRMQSPLPTPIAC